MEGELFRLRVVLRERRARLHRVDHHAGVVEPDAGYVVGAGERRLDRLLVAHVEVEEDIAGGGVPELRGVGLERPFDGRGGGQKRDLERDGLRRVARLGEGLGDHHRHRIADMAHPPDRERRARRHVGRRSVAVLHRHRAGDLADAVGFEVGAGIDREHAGRAGYGGGVERGDLAMPRGRAQEHGIGLARRVVVVGVAPAAGEQARVLGSRDRLADPEFEHAVVGHRNPFVVMWGRAALGPPGGCRLAGGARYSAAASSLRRVEASSRAISSSVSCTSPKWR